jgi:hypothetical protein
MRRSRGGHTLRASTAATTDRVNLRTTPRWVLPTPQRVGMPSGTAWRVGTKRGRKSLLDPRGLPSLRVVKVPVLLGFTLAAFKLERIRSCRAKHGLGRTVSHAGTALVPLERSVVVGSGRRLLMRDHSPVSTAPE